MKKVEFTDGKFLTGFLDGQPYESFGAAVENCTLDLEKGTSTPTGFFHFYVSSMSGLKKREENFNDQQFPTHQLAKEALKAEIVKRLREKIAEHQSWIEAIEQEGKGEQEK